MKRWGWWLVGGGLLLAVIWREGPTMVKNKIAQAIAYAEGFFVPDSRPAQNHNPGDLTQDLTGRGVGMDGPFIVYATDEDGWDALLRLVELMFEGSHIYNPSMTIREVASHYTTTDQQAWAQNVASRLGVSVDTPLEAID